MLSNSNAPKTQLALKLPKARDVSMQPETTTDRSAGEARSAEPPNIKSVRPHELLEERHILREGEPEEVEGDADVDAVALDAALLVALV